MENKIQVAIEILNQLIENEDQFATLKKEEREALLKAAGKLSRPDKESLIKRNKAIRKEVNHQQKQKERQIRAETGIRTARKASVFTAPSQLEDKTNSADNPSEFLEGEVSPRNCYVCKKEFTKVHHFYDSMCPDCARLNYTKRFQSANLAGKVALITGSRLKIGYQATLMLLRAGAEVIATTRFPVDSALRFSKESDFPQWKNRLHIYGLDLRHTPSVEIFTHFIEHKYNRLDILINNAAQTVRRPPAFYAHLIQMENTEFTQLPADAQTLLSQHHQCVHQLNEIPEPAQKGDISDRTLPALSWTSKKPGIGITGSANLSQIPYSHDESLSVEHVFPEGKLDADLQQVDLRKTNSWRLKLGEINTAEMLEIQLINAVAPFVLCNRLISLMKKDYTGQKHIINVSAMEGKFLKYKKGERHPHTNMAKAALNMLTHTSASELAKYGIYMNAVDTGWVTDEDPAILAARKQEQHDFQPPLDIVDGAARVLDPLFDGINTGNHQYGKFLKDYFPIDW